MTARAARRLAAMLLGLTSLISCLWLTPVAPAAAAPLNLDTLSASQEEQMLASRQLTSVDLVKAYLARIAGLNKSGPGLNAVTQINPDVLKEAEQADRERKRGIDLGPAMGLPIMLKDIVDATPMFNSAGDWALRNSYAPDSGVASELRAHGVVILGKLGLSEWANSFGSQPSGFSNLTGQVLNANDTGTTPSGSSSGSGAAASAGLSALTIGTETSGSIISPSTAEEDIGLRPTVGLVPGYGISPIDVSQDTAGPIVRTVSDAAMTLQSIAEYPGSDPTASQEYLDLMGPNYLGSPSTGYPSGLNDIPAPPSSWSGHLPNYMNALTTSFVQGKRIGYNSTCTGFAMSGSEPNVTYSCTAAETPQQGANDKAVVTLANAGATMVATPTDSTYSSSATSTLPTGWEQHATIDEYYKGINAQGQTPANLAAEVAYDNTNPQEAEKDGNGTHFNESLSDDSTITNPSSATALGTYNQAAFEGILRYRKIALHSAIDAQLQCPGQETTAVNHATIDLPVVPGSSPPLGGPTTVNYTITSCPASPAQAPVIAVIGSTTSSSPAAGYPQMVVPGGYTPTQRRPIGVNIVAGAYDEYDIIGIGYVLEQSQHLQQPPAMVDPASYRCARTVPAEPFASRGHCNPDYESVMQMLDGTQTILPFPLETTSAAELQAKLAAGTLTSEELVKAELTRIALANAEGPAIQAIRSLNPNAISDAIASDEARAKHLPVGPLAGIPFVVDDSIDAARLPTSDGSIALQDDVPNGDSTLVSRLKAAGAILLGDANVTEFDAMMENANMPQGYSSLGGQVLLAGDTNKNVGGSSGGSADSVATGFAPLAVGLETSTDSAQAIAPAGNAGVVALKATVGLVSRTGVLGVAKSQDSPAELGQTVTDVADELTAVAGADPADPATAGAPTGVNYAAGLTGPIELTGTTVGVIATTTAPYPAAVAEVTGLGGTVVTFTPPTGTTGTTAPSVIPYEFHKQLDSYLAASPDAAHGGPASLQDVIAYNSAHPVEGLKFQQDGLTGAEDVNYSDAGTTSTYQANLAQGRSDTRAVIDGLLSSTGAGVLMVPSGSGLVNIADRAGYPVLTIPAGYAAQNSNAGGDPIGVVLIGTAYSEPTLLRVGYELEQGMNVRNSGPSYMISATVPNPGFSGAPSETFQSDWRCVAGSAFFSPYDCNPGDLEGQPVPGFGTLGPRGNM